MVRTKADYSSSKSTAAKAPRKSLGSSNTSRGSSSSTSKGSGSSSSKRSGGGGGGGYNAVNKQLKVPTWQKGIGAFFGSPASKDINKENSIGSSSSLESTNSSGTSASSADGSSQMEKNELQKNNVISDDDD